VFLHDRKTKKTIRVSVGSGGNQGNGASFAPTISANGCVVAFESTASFFVAGDNNNARDIFVYDCKGKPTKLSRVSVRTVIGANGKPVIGADEKPLEVEGDGDSFSPALSANGRFVAFSSRASNLVDNDGNNAPDIFVYDRRKKQIKRVSINAAGQEGDRGSFSPSLSAKGKSVVFDSDAENLDPNVFDRKKIADVFFVK